MWENWLFPLIPVAFLLFFAGLWLFITKMMSLFGWSKFVPKFLAKGTPPSTAKSFAWQSLGFSRSIFAPAYRRSINGWVDDRGITLVPIYMFRKFHPMLCLGWNDIKSIEQKSTLNVLRTEVQMKEDLPVVILAGEMGKEVYNHWQRMHPAGRS